MAYCPKCGGKLSGEECYRHGQVNRSNPPWVEEERRAATAKVAEPPPPPKKKKAVDQGLFW